MASTVEFDRKVYFDSVRGPLFGGKLSQRQVNGQEAILGEWELPQVPPKMTDIRWLAYMLATTLHETASEMWPIEEYGKGKGMAYGKPDPTTGETYYGRGYVQLTWRDNYKRATDELGLTGEADLEWNPDMALDPQIAADVMFQGMRVGWFRGDSKGRHTLQRYFNDTINDAYNAREIINGDKTKVPSWSGGVSIGNLIKGYHGRFLSALNASYIEPEPDPGPRPERIVVHVNIQAPPGVGISVFVNGEEW